VSSKLSGSTSPARSPYHHLDGDYARPDALQHEPESQQAEVADDDRDGEEDSHDLERAERQRVARWERQDEHGHDDEVDHVPAPVAQVDVDRVHDGAQLLASVPVRQLQTTAP